MDADAVFDTWLKALSGGAIMFMFHRVGHASFGELGTELAVFFGGVFIVAAVDLVRSE